MASIQGRFVWYDLMTPAPAAAKSFYAAVAGWGTEAFSVPGNPGPTYDMWVGPNGPLGGMMEMNASNTPAGAPAHWLAYIAVDDCDAATAKAHSLGATIHRQPEDIPTVGRFAVVADPWGAPFMLFKPGGDSQPYRRPAVGEFAWNELLSGPAGEAISNFYGPLLGWAEMSRVDMGSHGPYVIYGQDGHQYGGMMLKPAEMPQAAWHFYIRVDDAKAGAARVKASGGEVRGGPMEVPDGSLVVLCADPQGAAFALLEDRRTG